MISLDNAILAAAQMEEAPSSEAVLSTSGRKLSFLKVSAVCMYLAKCQTKMSGKGGGGAETRRGEGWGGEQVSSTSATTGGFRPLILWKVGFISCPRLV